VIAALDVSEFGLRLEQTDALETMLLTWNNNPPPGMSFQEREEERMLQQALMESTRTATGRKEIYLEIDYDD